MLSESLGLTEESPVEIQNEEKINNVQMSSILKEYFKATDNNVLISILVVLFISAQVFGSLSDYWMAFW